MIKVIRTASGAKDCRGSYCGIFEACCGEIVGLELVREEERAFSL